MIVQREKYSKNTAKTEPWEKSRAYRKKFPEDREKWDFLYKAKILEHKY